jgi:hypothetical protein
MKARRRLVRAVRPVTERRPEPQVDAVQSADALKNKAFSKKGKKMKINAAVLVVLASVLPGSATAISYGDATCNQLVDEVVNTKKLFDKATADFVRQAEQPATKQEIVQLSLLTQRHDRAFAMLAVKCPATLSGIDFD